MLYVVVVFTKKKGVSGVAAVLSLQFHGVLVEPPLRYKSYPVIQGPLHHQAL